MIFQRFLMVFRFCAVVVLCFCGGLSSAQIGQKPSYYDHKRQQASPVFMQPQLGSAEVSSEQLWQNEVHGKNEFDQFARTYHQGTPFEIPHLIFVIDLQEGDQVYYLNTPYFQLHERFLRELLGTRLSRAEFNKNYTQANRRFIFGTLSWQNALQKYTYEFWEGDKLTPNLLSVTQKRVNETFFAPVEFKSNSTWHEEVAKSLTLPYVAQNDLVRQQSFMTLSTGTASGRLVLVNSEEDWAQVTEKDIVLLKDVPISIPPVAGVITEKPSTVLSHVNVLANSWKIPNIYLKDAHRILAPLMNEHVKFTAYVDNYHIEAAAQSRQSASTALPRLQLPRPNVSDFRMKPLSRLVAKDSVYCGAKAANLGAIKNHITTVEVPDGFCIPFAYYHAFMKAHGVSEMLEQMQSNPLFQQNSLVRKGALAQLQQMIMGWELDVDLVKRVVEQWQQQLNGQGVFVRSSSNSEDLPHFSGAGLYTTTPNVTTEAALEEAIKRSWASVFNFEAYEARRVARLPQDSVMMSVLVQVAVDAEASGVLITQNPFDRTQSHMTYIAAKRGIGIRVVEGQRVAEQVLYSSFSKAVRVLTVSQEESALQLDGRGGVREVALNVEPRVLTDDMVARLAAVGEKVKRLFSMQEQDIEWAVKEGHIIILQARPWIVLAK